MECTRKLVYNDFLPIDLAATNLFPIYKVKTGTYMPLTDFQQELLRQIIKIFWKEHKTRKWDVPFVKLASSFQN